MLSEYLAKKLHIATYKLLADGTYFGEIPGTKGVWANAKTLEACREELQSVLEEWLLLKIHSHEAVAGLIINKDCRDLVNG